MGTEATKPRGLGARHGARALISLAAVALGGALLSPCGAPAAPPEVEELARIEAIRKEGKLEEASMRAAPFLEHADPRVRGAAVGIVARVRGNQGRTGEAIEGLRRAAVLHREARQADEAVRDLEALAYTLLYPGRRFAEARAVLAEAEALATPAQGAPSSVPSNAMPSVRYYQGVLAFQTADFPSALRFLREALAGSETNGQEIYRASALQMLALVLQLLGREEEGETLLLDAGRSADECTRADALANLGWLRLRSQRDPKGAAELLDQSLALRESRCVDANARAAVLTDYALLRLREGRDDDARRKLNEARSAVSSPDGGVLAVWVDIEGQLALRAGKAVEAAALFDRLADLAEGGALPVAAWRAALGRARAFEALGRAREAGEAYERAEALVAKSSLLVPADEGRAGFLGALDESARAAVAFFLGRDPARAAAFARRARARAMTSLRWTERVAALEGTERARWDAAMTAYRTGRAALEAAAGEYWKLAAPELAKAIADQREAQARLTKQLDEEIASLFAGSLPGAGEPSAPAPRELVLVYHPTERGLAGFAVTAEGTAGKVLRDVDPGLPPEALSAALLEPFREAIARAARVRFIVAGPLDAIDFHALPWGDGPLLASVPVAYGTDAGAGAGRPISKTALVVADPRGDLPATRAEAAIVSEAVRAAGFEARALLGNAATYAAVREAIEAAPGALFHYAGHGSYGGAEGWESRLRLAEGSDLSVGDVIALRAAPAVVVLSGCETGRTAGGRAAGGLGLGHAFLVAGSRAVVAAARPLDDALAVQIVSALYREVGPADAFGDSLAERLRGAELGARASAPGSDWPNFRLLVP